MLRGADVKPWDRGEVGALISGGKIWVVDAAAAGCRLGSTTLEARLAALCEAYGVTNGRSAEGR